MPNIEILQPFSNLHRLVPYGRGEFRPIHYSSIVCFMLLIRKIIQTLNIKYIFCGILIRERQIEYQEITSTFCLHRQGYKV